MGTDADEIKKLRESRSRSETTSFSVVKETRQAFLKVSGLCLGGCTIAEYIPRGSRRSAKRASLADRDYPRQVIGIMPDLRGIHVFLRLVGAVGRNSRGLLWPTSRGEERRGPGKERAGRDRDTVVAITKACVLSRRPGVRPFLPWRARTGHGLTRPPEIHARARTPVYACVRKGYPAYVASAIAEPPRGGWIFGTGRVYPPFARACVESSRDVCVSADPLRALERLFLKREAARSHFPLSKLSRDSR